MAEGGLRRFIRLILDAAAARRMERDAQDALARATDPKGAKKLGAETERAMQRSAAAIKRLGGAVLGFFAVREVFRFFGDATRAANALDSANRKLEATSKITGVRLDFLQLSAGRVKEQFRLGTALANDFTVELAKLTAKAGDIRQLEGALGAFLDIGAARGLSAQQTLDAVRQAIIGIDEGTDKLFNKNPSVLYKEYADRIGAVAAKLTDQQKAQAIVDAALRDGARVRGEYLRWLQTAAGQQFLLANRIEETKAAFGQALQPALVAILPIVTKVAEGLTNIINALRGVKEQIDALQSIRADPALQSLENIIPRLSAERQEREKLLAERQRLAAEIRRGPGIGRGSERAFQQLLKDLGEVDKRLKVLDASIPELEKKLIALNQPLFTPPETGGDGEKDPLQKRIDLLEKAFNLQKLTQEETRELFRIEAQLAQQISRGIPDLEKRVDIAGKLRQVTSITAQLREPSEFPLAGPREGARAAGFRAFQRGRTREAPPIFGPRLEADKQLIEEFAAGFREQMAGIEDVAQMTAASISDAFRVAFSIAREEGAGLVGFAQALFQGFALAGINGLAAFASRKVAQNIAAGFEALASAKAAAASTLIGNPAGPAAAAAFGVAAKGHFFAAAKWGLLAGAAGAAGAAVEGGVGGRGAASASPSERDRGGGRTFDATPSQQIHIYIDPLNPESASWQRNFAATERYVRERFGEDAHIVIHPRTGVPTTPARR